MKYQLSNLEKDALTSVRNQLQRISDATNQLNAQYNGYLDDIYTRLGIKPETIGKEIKLPDIDLKTGIVVVTPIEKGEIEKTKKK
jgi:hypothetical protein